MKAIFLLVIVIALVSLILAVVWLTIDNRRLRRRMDGLEEPELWLPRRERRAHARKLLKREDDAYEQQMMARLNEVIRGAQPHLEEK